MSTREPPAREGAESTAKFVDGIGLPEEKLEELLKQPKPLRLDWANKWLTGEEYAHVLANLEAYCEAFGFQKFSQKTHPECIYKHPKSKPPGPLTHCRVQTA